MCVGMGRVAAGTRTRIEMRVEAGDYPKPMKYEVVIGVIG